MRAVFIAFIACNIAFIAFVACDRIYRMRYPICQAAPYSGTSSVRTISNDGCSTTFIVFDVAGEAADEAEEEASAVLPRRVVVVDVNRPLPPPSWAEAVVGSHGGGGGGGGRDTKGMTQGGAHDGAEGSRESEEKGEHVMRRENFRGRL